MSINKDEHMEFIPEMTTPNQLQEQVDRQAATAEDDEWYRKQHTAVQCDQEPYKPPHFDTWLKANNATDVSSLRCTSVSRTYETGAIQFPVDEDANVELIPFRCTGISPSFYRQLFCAMDITDVLLARDRMIEELSTSNETYVRAREAVINSAHEKSGDSKQVMEEKKFKVDFFAGVSSIDFKRSTYQKHMVCLVYDPIRGFLLDEAQIGYWSSCLVQREDQLTQVHRKNNPSLFPSNAALQKHIETLSILPTVYPVNRFIAGLCCYMQDTIPSNQYQYDRLPHWLQVKPFTSPAVVVWSSPNDTSAYICRWLTLHWNALKPFPEPLNDDMEKRVIRYDAKTGEYHVSHPGVLQWIQRVHYFLAMAIIERKITWMSDLLFGMYAAHSAGWIIGDADTVPVQFDTRRDTLYFFDWTRSYSQPDSIRVQHQHQHHHRHHHHHPHRSSSADSIQKKDDVSITKEQQQQQQSSYSTSPKNPSIATTESRPISPLSVTSSIPSAYYSSSSSLNNLNSSNSQPQKQKQQPQRKAHITWSSNIIQPATPSPPDSPSRSPERILLRTANSNSVLTPKTSISKNEKIWKQGSLLLLHSPSSNSLSRKADTKHNEQAQEQEQEQEQVIVEDTVQPTKEEEEENEQYHQGMHLVTDRMNRNKDINILQRECMEQDVGKLITRMYTWLKQEIGFDRMDTHDTKKKNTKRTSSALFHHIVSVTNVDVEGQYSDCFEPLLKQLEAMLYSLWYLQLPIDKRPHSTFLTSNIAASMIAYHSAFHLNLLQKQLRTALKAVRSAASIPNVVLYTQLVDRTITGYKSFLPHSKWEQVESLCSALITWRDVDSSGSNNNDLQNRTASPSASVEHMVILKTRLDMLLHVFHRIRWHSESFHLPGLALSVESAMILITLTDMALNLQPGTDVSAYTDATERAKVWKAAFVYRMVVAIAVALRVTLAWKQPHMHTSDKKWNQLAYSRIVSVLLMDSTVEEFQKPFDTKDNAYEYQHTVFTPHPNNNPALSVTHFRKLEVALLQQLVEHRPAVLHKCSKMEQCSKQTMATFLRKHLDPYGFYTQEQQQVMMMKKQEDNNNNNNNNNKETNVPVNLFQHPPSTDLDTQMNPCHTDLWNVLPFLFWKDHAAFGAASNVTVDSVDDTSYSYLWPDRAFRDGGASHRSRPTWPITYVTFQHPSYVFWHAGAFITINPTSEQTREEQFNKEKFEWDVSKSSNNKLNE